MVYTVSFGLTHPRTKLDNQTALFWHPHRIAFGVFVELSINHLGFDVLSYHQEKTHENFVYINHIDAIENIVSHITQCPHHEKSQGSSLRSQNCFAYELLFSFPLINMVKNVVVLSLLDSAKPKLQITLRTCPGFLINILCTDLISASSYILNLTYSWDAVSLSLI